MHIHYEDLSDVARYIEKHAEITLDDKKPTLENILNNIKRHKNLNGESRNLEIGAARFRRSWQYISRAGR